MTAYTRLQYLSFILNQTNPVHTLRFCYLQIRFNIIFPSTPRFSNWSVSFRFLQQNTFLLFLYSRNMPRPSHYPCFHRPNNIWQRVRFSSGTSLSLPHRLTYLPHLTLINIKYQVPHPYITPRDVPKSESCVIFHEVFVYYSEDC
jgi:hypothetical protein